MHVGAGAEALRVGDVERLAAVVDRDAGRIPAGRDLAQDAVASVPPAEVGVASGTNSALRELGGVFGVAILAAVFTRQGVYGSSQTFVDGFVPALWVGAALSAMGIIAAVLTPRRPRVARQETGAAAAPAMSLAGEGGAS
jgi:hypothetical protein